MSYDLMTCRETTQWNQINNYFRKPQGHQTARNSSHDYTLMNLADHIDYYRTVDLE